MTIQGTVIDKRNLAKTEYVKQVETDLEATTGRVDTLETQTIVALQGRIDELTAKALTADSAEIQNLKVKVLEIDGLQVTVNAITGELVGIKADAETQKQTTNSIKALTQANAEALQTLILDLNARMSFGAVRNEQGEPILDEDGNEIPLLRLGNDNSEFAVEVSNVGLVFLQGKTPVAWLTNNQLFINSAIVVEGVQIGDFMWASRQVEGANGTNLYLKWIGEK